MRRILFLDDSEPRLNVARNTFGNEELYLANTADMAIWLLSKTGPWDLVMLDHDLGGQIFQDSFETNTGMEVVRYIERTMPEIREIIIHSWNTSAGHDMMKRLKKLGYNADYQPFKG